MWNLNLSPSAEAVLSQFTLKKNPFQVQFMQMKMTKRTNEIKVLDKQ